MSTVIIGVDPHKMSVTIEVLDDHEQRLGTGRYATDQGGYAAMRRYVKQWSNRLWAVEGANGAGRPLAQRLVAAGEQVVDVPAKLAARVRLFDTGHQQVQTVNRLQRLLSELLPGQRKRDLSAAQAKAMLATVRPRDIAGKTWRRMAAEQLADLAVLDAKLKKIKVELAAAVTDRGSHLMDVFGLGLAGAARTLADVDDVARFADRNRFASWTGTTPLDASSGEQNRHRLSRARNRRMNHVPHIAAIVQIRHDTDGREYYRRKRAAGKTSMEALSV